MTKADGLDYLFSLITYTENSNPRQNTTAANCNIVICLYKIQPKSLKVGYLGLTLRNSLRRGWGRLGGWQFFHYRQCKGKIRITVVKILWELL